MKKKRNRFYSIKQKREKIAILFFSAYFSPLWALK